MIGWSVSVELSWLAQRNKFCVADGLVYAAVNAAVYAAVAGLTNRQYLHRALQLAGFLTI